MKFRGLVAAVLMLAAGLLPSHAAVRTYYIAADEIDWNYMPLGVDVMMPGMPPMGYAKYYATQGPHLIGKVYRKAVYRQYTDATFTSLKLRPADEVYLGLMGPILRAEVGDTIRIIFRNHGTHAYSMHPHGVFYDKSSEGAGYDDGVAAAQKPGAAVAPGQTVTYNWEVPERAGPGPRDPSSIVWLYHSHADERKDVNAGLVGVIVITKKGMALADGRPKDVDKEFVVLPMFFDENQSGLLEDSIKKFTGDPAHVDRFESAPKNPDGTFDFLGGTGFGAQNVRATVNGFQFGNGPVMTMKKGDRVRWYVVTLGEGINVHTPHWHGNVVVWNGLRTDVLSIAPAQMLTADMVPDAPGIWLFHCHFSEHMEQGMSARYEVLP